MKKLVARTKFIISKTPAAFSMRIRNVKSPIGMAIFVRRKKEHSKNKRIEKDRANDMIMNILEGGMKKIKIAHNAKKQVITIHLIHDFDLLDVISVRQFTCNYYWYLL